MQVSVETTGALGRRMTVQVPAEQVDQEVETRLKSISRTAKLDGFRPGKVPFRVVEQKFGKQVHFEVASDLMNSTLQEALTQESLRPVSTPQVEPQTLEKGMVLEYVATFEVYPEFEPNDLSDVAIEKPVVDLGDQDVDAMLEKLRKQKVSWEAVDRVAQDGDQVTVDFVGTIEGEAFEGGSAEGMPLELGSNSFIEGFETKLLGASVGDEPVLDLSFPEDYGKAELAGKPVQFKVTVQAIAAPKLPELDDEFAAAFSVGDGGIVALREEIKSNMQRELGQAVTAEIKDQVFDALLARNEIDIPAALVDAEAERMAQEAVQQADGKNKGLNLPSELFADQASRRVKLGLVIGEFVKRQDLKVDSDKVRQKVETVAAGYESPEEVVQWYFQNKEAMEGIQSLVLEEQIVDWLLGTSKTHDKSMSFEDLMENRQQKNG